MSNMKITAKSDNIRVEGHKGTWYVVDEMDYKEYGKVFLLEHEYYGDEAPHIIINEYNEIVLEDVWNGFDDLEEL